MILFVLTFLNAKLLYVVLPPEDNGIYFLVMGFALSINLIMGEWLRLTNINLAGESSENTPKLAMNVLTYVLFIGSILLATAFFSDTLRSVLPGLPAKYTIPVIVIGLCFVIRASFQSLLLVNKYMTPYGLTYIIWGVLIVTMNAVLVYVFRLGLSYALLSLFVASFLSACWPLVNIWKRAGVGAKPSLRLFRRSGLLGGRAVIAVLGMFFMIRIHAFSIEPFSRNPETGLFMVGMFSVCFKIYQLFQRLSDVTGSVLYAHISSDKGQKGYELTAAVCRNMLWFLSIACITAGLLGKYLIYIIASSEYYEAYMPLMCLLPGIVCMNVGSIVNSSYWGRGYPYYIIFAPYFAGLAGFCLNWLLIPRHGATGASVSFTVAAILWFIYLVGVFKRDSNLPLSAILLLRKSDMTRVAAKMRRRIAGIKAA